MIYLWYYSNDTIRIDEPIGNSLENNGVAVGLLVSVEGGCIIVYAGQKKLELVISSFSTGESVDLEENFGWEGIEKVEGNFICAMDHYQRLIVLGFRRSIFLFRLADDGSLEEPDKLAGALNYREAEHIVLEEGKSNSR